MNLQFDNFRKETKPFLKKNSNDRITEKSPTFKLKIDWLIGTKKDQLNKNIEINFSWKTENRN
jgi:hypothetical protein